MKYKDLRTLIATLFLVRGRCIMLLYAEEGGTINIECSMKIPVNELTWRGPPGLKTYSSGYHKADLEHVNASHLTKNNTPTLQIVNFTAKNEGLYQCRSFRGGYETFNVILFRPFSAPKNIKAIALDTLIIVKWTANRNTEFKEIYFVEYRTHLETSWKTVSVAGSTALINGLAPHTVYFLRVYSKIAAGESYKTEEIMVKTEKSQSMVPILSAEFAVILGAVLFVIALCWCSMIAFQRGTYLRRNQDRVTPSQRNDEASVRIEHYDEIDSMYYNPNNIPMHVKNETRAQLEIHLPSNKNGNEECDDTKNSANQNVVNCTVHHMISSDISLSSSSTDGSYLVPHKKYIDYENPANGHKEKNMAKSEISIEELSISSNNSETNLKSIRKYDVLNLSDIEDHSYETTNKDDT